MELRERLIHSFMAMPGVGAARARPPVFIWLPALVVGAGMLLPLAYLIIRTLGAGNELWELLLRSRTLEILLRSVVLVLAVSGASLLIAVPLAWLTVRTDLPLRRLWSVLTVLPLAIPSYVGGFLVVSALGPRGLLQQLLEGPFGVQRLPEMYGLPGAALTLAFLTYPYVLLTVRGALWGMDRAAEETARSLGLGPLGVFLRVTLPQLRPAIAAGALLVGLYALSDFGAVSLLRYETFTWAIYVQYQSAFNRTLAAGLSLVLMVVAFAMLAWEMRARGRARYDLTAPGSQRPPAVARLGVWKWPAFLLCGIIVSVALLLPMAVLGYWLQRGVAEGEPLLLLWNAMKNSIVASGLAAAAAGAAALPVSILTVRYSGRLGTLLEQVSYTGFALPGIVVALALVFFGVNFACPLYGTMGLLVFAYVVLFLPAALGPIRTSLLQVSPRMEEASRALGRRQLKTLATVTVPLVWPGILSGTAMVFLVAMKELAATLILSPVGFKTLATSIWSAASEAFFAQAAAPALLLVLVSSVPVAVLLLRERRWQQ